MTRIPLSGYEEPVIVVEVFKNLTQTGWWAGSLVLAIGLWAIVFRRRIWAPWSELPNARLTRGLTVVSAITLAWAFSTYEYNFYFARSHLADRILLPLLVVLLYWRPLFILPFVAVIYAVAFQFDCLPGVFYSLAELRLPANILLLGSAMFILRSLKWKGPTDLFPFALCCLVAAHYWPSGLEKLRTEWLWSNHVEFLVPAAYSTGWHGWLSSDQIAALTGFLAKLNPGMKFFTILVECGGLFMLWNRRIAIGLILGFIGFHAGVLLMSGILFWMWTLCEISILYFLLKDPDFRRGEVFSIGRACVGFLIVFTSPKWLAPESLSWADAPVNYVYRFQAEGESGRKYSLTPRFFAPYDYGFTITPFASMSKHSVLPIVMGATGREIADPLTAASAVDEVLMIEQRLGSVAYDQELTERVTAFARRLIANRNARLPESGSNGEWFSAPSLFCIFSPENEWRGEEEIRRVEVFEVMSYYEGMRYQEIRNRLVHAFDIPRGE